MFRFSSAKSFGKTVYLAAGTRTPIGSFLGSYLKFSATQLGAFSAKATIAASGIKSDQIDQVILGNVVSSGLGQAPARQVSLKAGIPQSVPCTSINKVCSSGIKSICLGAQTIGLGLNHSVLAGGFESMSNIPHLLAKYRKGIGFGDGKIIDAMSNDGLVDAYSNFPMGLVAQKTATELSISRQVLDAYSLSSYERLRKAQIDKVFQKQIAPVQIDNNISLDQDQQIKNYKPQKIPQLRPAFSKTGVNTAGNSSKISDGACTVLLMSEEALKKNNIKPIAKIVSYADAQISPNDFCIAPNFSAKKALELAGMTIGQIDLFEINQAFAVAALANMKLMDISKDRININGGAIAMGHPIGMSGARIVLTVALQLQRLNKRFGLAAICNGGGGSTAMIVQKI